MEAGDRPRRRVVLGQAPTVAWSGFTTVTDIAFDPDGNRYVLGHSTGPVFFACPEGCARRRSSGVPTSRT